MKQHRRRTETNHVNLRMERWHRRAIHSVVIALTATGIAWLSAHYFLRRAGEFGETIHPLEPWSMKLHGAAAMLMLFFAGSVMNSHIRRAARAGLNLGPGWSLVAALAALTASGYVLWDVAGESSRGIWSLFHWIIGLLLPALLAWHIGRGRRHRAAGR
jgi:hypothetical protein